MSFNTTPTSSTNNVPYMGIQEQNPRETYIRRRDPTPNDYRGYKLGDRWINKATGTWCTLVSKANGIATWLCISGSTFVNTLNGCSGAITIAGGVAIDVVTACPALTIDVRVDGVTIGVNGANQLEVIPSGILDSLQFDPDVGANVSPVGAIIQVPGIGGNQTLNGGAGILQFNNRRWLSAYVVDPSIVPGSDAEFTTIQAAINAAFAAGGGVIYVRPSTYIENLTLEPGVELIGVTVDGRANKVVVQGNHTMSSDGLFMIDDIDFEAAAGDTFTLNNAALGSSTVLLIKNSNVNASAGRCFVATPAVGASAQFACYEVQGGASLDCFDLSEQSGAQLEQSFFFSSNNCMNLNGTGSVQAVNTRFNASNNCFFFANNLHGLDLEICQCFSGQEIINFSAAGSSANARHCTFGSAAASTFCVTGTGTFEYADLINSGASNIIDPAVTQVKLNWQPYGESGLIASAYRGTAAFDNTQFTVTDGFVQLISPGAPVTTLGVDVFTPPGTDPVVPDGLGNIDVTGAQIAAGSTVNVIQTNSIAANQMVIEIQRASAQVASTVGSNGVSHYDSAQFTIDADGFVQILGGPAVTMIDVDTFTPPGTDPVLPAPGGSIQFTGGQVAAGTTANVIQTNSVAATQVVIEVQRSSESATTNSSLNGVSHYDSADFTVDPNGFVSLVGTGLVSWNLISVNTVGLANNGYIAISPGGALTVSLPATSAVGDIFELVLDGATSWQLTQAAGQQVRLGALTTTLGAGGSLTSTGQGDYIRLVCRVANTIWTAVGYTGVITVV